MTKREMYEAIVNGNVTEEVVTMAKNELVKMDNRNAKRRETPSKTAKENAPLKEKILEILTEVPMTAKEVGEKMDLSTAKASALLGQIEGLNVTEVKVKGGRKVKGYALAQCVINHHNLRGSPLYWAVNRNGSLISVLTHKDRKNADDCQIQWRTPFFHSSFERVFGRAGAIVRIF